MNEQLTLLTLEKGAYPEDILDRLRWLMDTYLVPENGPLEQDPVGVWVIRRFDLQPGEQNTIEILDRLDLTALSEYLNDLDQTVITYRLRYPENNEFFNWIEDNYPGWADSYLTWVRSTTLEDSWKQFRVWTAEQLLREELEKDRDCQ